MKRGLAPQMSYLVAVQFLQIQAGFGPLPREQWQLLHYVVRGAKRTGADSPCQSRLPITAEVLRSLGSALSTGSLEDLYMARLLWAACCLGFFEGR